MLLAGGQGSRLHDLTRCTAKPAVSFGGKYRIIDFALSNCTNSGIDTVGVLTQYQPLDLNEYIGNGAPWDLDRARGGVSVLPPYQGVGRADWYRGTATAIYQNLAFMRRDDPEYVAAHADATVVAEASEWRAVYSFEGEHLRIELASLHGIYALPIVCSKEQRAILSEDKRTLSIFVGVTITSSVPMDVDTDLRAAASEEWYVGLRDALKNTAKKGDTSAINTDIVLAG